MAQIPYAELHCHTNFSFLDGASPVDDLAERAVELGPDRAGRHRPRRAVRRGPLRHRGRGGRAPSGRRDRDRAARSGGRRIPTGSSSARAGRGAARRRGTAARPTAGPARRASRAGRRGPARPTAPDRARLPGHRRAGQGGPARDRRAAARAAPRPARPDAGRLSEPVPARLARQSRRDQGRAAVQPGAARRAHARASSRCPAAARARSPAGCGSAIGPGARAVAERYATLFGRGDGPATRGFFIELSHHLLPDDDWLVAETSALADELGLPVVVTNDVHYARPEDRELHDVLTAIRHGRTLDTLGDLRRPDGESYLKSGAELAGAAARRGRRRPATRARAWARGDRDRGRARRVLLGRPRVRAVPLPGLPGARRGDAVLVPLGAVLGGRPEALPPADLGGRQRGSPTSSTSSSGPASPSSS